jgi:hypothetical protein
LIRAHARGTPAFLAGFAIVLIAGLGGCTGTATRQPAPPVTSPVTPPVAPISVTVSPGTSSVIVGQNQPFTATLVNDSSNRGVNWALSGSGCSGATCGGLSAASSASGVAVTYMAPGSVPNPATVTLTATSVADTTKTATATITVGAAPPVSVTITPKRGGLVLAQTATFTATVTNDVAGAGVTWAATSGSFSAQTATTATYVAPASPGSITITATSVADTTKNATATIGVTDLAGVTTYHNDLSRDGANVQEYALNTTNVTSASFGKLFSCTVDGAVYAQSLWVPNVNIGGGTHNVIVVATMRDSVYVLDADTNPCQTYWKQTLIPTGETYGNNSDVVSADIFPDIGILGTPVIDPATNTIYLVTKTKTSSTNYIQRLHALNLLTGAEQTNSPVVISASAAGNCEGGTTILFNPLTENQRPGLALSNGMVYVSWASHGDNGMYHGWVLGYQTANLAAVPAVFNDTPNKLGTTAYCKGGIWMSGGAPAFDTAGNMYVLTGNGIFDGTSGSATLPTDFSDSYLKLSAPTLGVLDYFTPFNQGALDTNDSDVGSSGTAVLIDTTTGPNQHLLVGGSKGQIFFLLNRDNMGKYNSTADMVVQEWQGNSSSFQTPGFWNNNLYYFGVVFGSTTAGTVFPFNPTTRLFGTTSTATTPSQFGFAGATPSISASSATADGILWAIDTANYGTSDHGAALAGPAVLHAFDASNIATELWNSSQATGGRDTAGNAVKFTVPTVANGKVYIGTRGSDNTQGGGTTFGEIDVYGLLPN